MPAPLTQWHGQLVSDVADIEGFTQGTVALSTSAAQTTDPLAEGIYDLWTTADCYIRIGPTATGVTTSNGYLLRTGQTVPFIVRADCRIGGIVGASTATLSYHKVG